MVRKLSSHFYLNLLEPDLYDAFERLTPAQVAQGYKALRSVLDSYNLYKNSILVGPALAGIKIGNGHYQFIKELEYS